MSALTGNTVASTYQSLIKIADNSTVGASLENLTDGAGNATALSISNQQVAISGSLQVTGSILLSGSLIVPVTGSSLSITGSIYVDPANNKLWIYTGNGGVSGWVTSSLG